MMNRSVPASVGRGSIVARIERSEIRGDFAALNESEIPLSFNPGYLLDSSQLGRSVSSARECQMSFKSLVVAIVVAVVAVFAPINTASADCVAPPFFFCSLDTKSSLDVLGCKVRSLKTRRAVVKQLYLHFLNRGAENEGLTYWASRLESGGCVTNVVGGLVESDEYYWKNGYFLQLHEYVSGLYKNVLGRPPESTTALANWVNNTGANGWRSTASGIGRSAESSQRWEKYVDRGCRMTPTKGKIFC
jgi:Domain of unknown function (DUF4214)